MKLGNMFKKTNQKNYITLTNRKANVQNSGESSPEVPEGLMRKCNACRAVVLAESIIGNQYICPKCGKNLNEGKCGCPEKEIDPRLSALADLLNN